MKGMFFTEKKMKGKNEIKKAECKQKYILGFWYIQQIAHP